MIERIEHRGSLVHECSQPGDTRADDVYPGHPNGIQVSARRFVLLFATRGYRGGDDARSIIYQVRDGGFDGPVLSEGRLVRTLNDWDPFNDGSAYVRQQSHVAGFGVPKGTLIRGQPVPHANLFAVKWYRTMRIVDPATGFLRSGREHPELTARTLGVEWVQLRLNDAEDDIEIVQSVQRLRERGYEDGAAFCSAAVRWMNQSMVQAVPFNDDASEWADVNHFDGGWLAALKYRYNPQRGVYEWVETGPLVGDHLSEASLARYRDEWIISARTGGEVAWIRTDDPFGALPAARQSGTDGGRGGAALAGRAVQYAAPDNNAPLTAYTCADGVLRLLGGDWQTSPHDSPRNPLYLWDIDPERGFAATNRREVYNSVKAGLPVPPDGPATAGKSPGWWWRHDMAKLLPHAGGRVQLIAHRIVHQSTNDPGRTGLVVTPEEKDVHGLYYAAIHHTEPQPSPWQFATDD